LLFKYLKEANIFVIYSLHDCWAFTGHCTYFVSENCNRWQKECYGCPLKKDYPTSWFIDRSRRNFIIKKEMTCALNKMIVVTVSDWLKGLVEKSFLKKFPVYRIYNGVRTETFTYRLGRKDMWPGKKVLIGCALRWDDSNGKGLYDYLKLAKILSPEYIIVLVGHFDNPKTLASLPKNIINVDRTENQVKLAEYYSRADVLMNLSYQETMGLTSVEGMACGIPCVVYNTTASPELITPETGITVEPGNIKEVWNAVKELVAKGKVKYRDACRNRALDQFDEVKQFSKYLDLYEKIIGQEMTI
jgi:putative colanic acid biosynthesis glycosyltransferase